MKRRRKNAAGKVAGKVAESDAGSARRSILAYLKRNGGGQVADIAARLGATARRDTERTADE